MSDSRAHPTQLALKSGKPGLESWLWHLMQVTYTLCASITSSVDWTEKQYHLEGLVFGLSE